MGAPIQKPRVIKDFEKLDQAIQEQIKLTYPTGFFEHLITYTDRDGNDRFALPFETDDKYYMVRMTISEAKRLINDDDDYDDNGVLRNDVQEMYQEKYQDLDYISEFDAIAAPEIEIDDKEIDDDDDDDNKPVSKKKSKFDDEDDEEDEDEDFDDEDFDDEDFDDEDEDEDEEK